MVFRTGVLMAMVGLTSMGAQAATLNVPSQFGTIQAAIDASSSGDTILVAPGTYNTKLNMNGKNVTLRATGGPTVTTINAAGQNDSVITCSTSETSACVIDGFTLTGGAGKLVATNDRRGGAIYCNVGEPTVLNCIIRNNSATRGGGFYNFFADPIVRNCIFTQNTVAQGGGMYNDFSNPLVTNSTFAFDVAGIGSGMYNSNSTPRLINCITWGYDDDSFGGPGTPIVTYSMIDTGGPNAYPGKGNKFGNPMFVSSSDFHLQANSPCIDAGDSQSIASNTFKDLDKNPRGVDVPAVSDTGLQVFGLTVDFGAYEYQVATGGGPDTCPTDVNDDGFTGIADLLQVIAEWGVCP